MTEFRQMRRNRQLLPAEMTEEIIKRGSSGVLALMGDDGYPYAVPVSYAYENGRLWFHGATTGHKVDAIRRCDKASICVVAKDDVVPERFTTHYRSVIAFGRIRIVEDDDEKRTFTARIAAKYSPSMGEAEVQREIDREWSALGVYEMTIEHMTGKEAIELVREREER